MRQSLALAVLDSSRMDRESVDLDLFGWVCDFVQVVDALGMSENK